MSRMNHRVDKALKQFPISAWSHQLFSRQFRNAMRISSNRHSWPFLCKNLHPSSTNFNAYRSPGRPRLRWDDRLSSFSVAKYGAAN